MKAASTCKAPPGRRICRINRGMADNTPEAPRPPAERNDVADWLNGSGSTVVSVILVVLTCGFIYQVVKALL